VVDRQAHADQAALIERAGGKEVMLKRGFVRHTPSPGMKADLHPLDRLK
jgi:hypothetical protein